MLPVESVAWLIVIIFGRKFRYIIWNGANPFISTQLSTGDKLMFKFLIHMLSRYDEVEVHTGSQYVWNCLELGWIYDWIDNDWLNSQG